MGEARSDVATSLPPQEDEQLQQQPQELEQEQEPTFRLLVAPPASAQLKDKISLDQVSPGDTVLSLRQLIGEQPELACYTCYHLEVENAADGTSVPVNDFVELGDVEAVTDGSTVKMVLEKYDARKVRNHVRRFRDVLANPPIPQVAEIEALAAATKSKSKDGESASEKQQIKDAEKQLDRLREIHEKLAAIELPVKPELSDFYTLMPGNATNDKTATSPVANDKKKGNKKDKKGKKAVVEETESLEDAKLPKCIKSIVFSGYNPPPASRKLAGDLMYLEIVLEDNTIYHVTAYVNGFYINRSTSSTFDPSPAKNSCQSHMLLDVLSKASDSFRSSYTSLLAKAAALAKQGPASIEWMVASGNHVGGKQSWATHAATETKHEYDLNRAEDELCTTFGVDERGVIRDWNEEYQSCRELPATNLKEQLVRSRVLYKIVSEFVEAATQGAVAIVEGQIPPINPMDDASAHVYVFNNIFFSLSIDGKCTAKDIGGEEAAFSSANRDLQGVKAFNEADIPGLHTLATVVVDYMGVRIIAQSVIPGILQGEASSKLVYGSVDGGKTIASNEKMHSLMLQASEKLHIAERTIQPLGPDAEGEQDEAASPANVGGEAGTVAVKLCGPVEAKGILGSDGRMYVLDLVRITSKDWTFYVDREQKTSADEGLCFKRDDEGYVALLRPELVQLYSMWKHNQTRKEKREALRKEIEAKKKEEKATETEGEASTETTEETEESKESKEKKSEESAEIVAAFAAIDEEVLPPVLLNPNVFMKYDASTDKEVVAADEAAAKDAADYLQKVVIPAFVADVRRGSIAPADGHALTELMHSCGINMRYLGRLASLAKKLEAVGGISKFFLELVESEMIARVTKHILASVLNANENVRAAPGETIVQILNGIFGSSGSSSDEDSFGTNKKSKKSNKNKKKAAAKTEAEEVPSASNGNSGDERDSDSIWQRIKKEVQNRFDYSLSLWESQANPETEENAVNRVHKNVLLRRICQRVGLRVAGRNYDFTSTHPFSLEDLTGLVPVVKTSLPAHPLPQAKQLLERGRILLGGGALPSAYEMLQEASTLLFQVCGAAHEDSALCSSSLATVLYHAGDIAGAIAQQQRALALYTQLCGIDYHDTAFAHANLALFLHANGQTDLAVAHVHRAIYLLEFCSGPHFPEISSLYFKMGMMCQDVGQITLALLCHRESLRRGEFDRLQAANTLHQMALACSLVGGFREALAYEKKVFALYQEVFGDSDPRTQESAKYIKVFTEKAVEGAKDRKEVDAAAAADAIANELLAELQLTETADKKKGKKTKVANKAKH